MNDGSEGTVQIEASDVIRLIEQFMKENGLKESLRALQAESSVVLNAVENVEAFANDIHEGKWDLVLQAVSQLKLPQRKLMDLYYQIIVELIEMRELNAARSLLRQTEPMQVMKDRFPDRYLKLESLMSKIYFEPHLAYPDGRTKEAARAALAEALSSEISAVPRSRLVTLLQQALRWQAHQGLLPPGSQFDILRGTVPNAGAQDDTFPATLLYTLRFDGSGVESAQFSPDGQLLVTGSVDGLIEVWNGLSGKLRKDLKYQEEEAFMMMDSAVLALCFSRDSTLLASGDSDGNVRVWNVQTGATQRRFAKAHAQGITSLRFTRDGAMVLSASFDGNIRLHGLRSGHSLRDFRGHTAFVNDVCFSSDGSRVLSASSDGTLRVWDATTAECQTVLRPRTSIGDAKDGTAGDKGPGSLLASVAPATLSALLPLPLDGSNSERVLVVAKAPVASIMSIRGQTSRSFTTASDDVSFLAGALSFRGQYAFLGAEDRFLYCFNLETGNLDHRLRIGDEQQGKEIVGVIAHPQMCLVIVYTADGVLRAYKA